MLNKANFKEWFNRYKYAELSAICAVLISSQLQYFFDAITTAYLISFSEYIAFYGMMLFTTYRALIKTNQSLNQKTTSKDILLLAQNLVLEFGYPALLDFFVIRPFCMYWMPILVGNYYIGILLGKITADSFFYTCAIINYEWIKRKP